MSSMPPMNPWRERILPEERTSWEKNHTSTLRAVPVPVPLVFEIVSDFSPSNLFVSTKTTTFLSLHLDQWGNGPRSDCENGWFACAPRNNPDRTIPSSNPRHTTRRKMSGRTFHRPSYIEIPIFITTTTKTRWNWRKLTEELLSRFGPAATS